MSQYVLPLTLTAIVIFALFKLHKSSKKDFSFKLVTSTDSYDYLEWYVSRNFKGAKITDYKGRKDGDVWDWEIWVKY